MIIWQNEVSSHLVWAAANVSLLTEQREAGHGHEDSLQVDAPQVHEENDLKSKDEEIRRQYKEPDIWTLLIGKDVNLLPIAISMNEPHLHFDVRLSADCNLRTHVGVASMPLQELVPAL